MRKSWWKLILVAILPFIIFLCLMQNKPQEIQNLITNETKINPFKYPQYVVSLLYSHDLSETLLLARPFFDVKENNKYYRLDGNYQKIVKYNGNLFIIGEDSILRMNGDTSFDHSEIHLPDEYYTDAFNSDSPSYFSSVNVIYCNPIYGEVMMFLDLFEFKSYKVISYTTFCNIHDSSSKKGE